LTREQVLRELCGLICAWGAGDEAEIAPLLREALAPLRDQEVTAAVDRLASTGDTWDYHPPDAVGRAVSRAIMRHVLGPGSELSNAGALAVARRSPAVLLANHLSFVDVNVFDSLVSRAGYADVAERFAALVGPKVFGHPIRRLASLCFGTIKLPQSQSRASGEARMPGREVARLAVGAIRIARERQRQGDHLVIFPEGTRSRARALEPLLPAVARYLGHPDSWVLPWAHWGSEQLFPIGEDRVYPSAVRVRIGTPLEARRLLDRCRGHRPLIANVIGFLIADLLPGPYRGVYAKGEGELEPAREIASELGATS
jgi:1-acyl-sn-glycerol-3-phosphate acyltransferase